MHSEQKALWQPVGEPQTIGSHKMWKHIEPSCKLCCTDQVLN